MFETSGNRGMVVGNGALPENDEEVARVRRLAWPVALVVRPLITVRDYRHDGLESPIGAITICSRSSSVSPLDNNYPPE